jgi:hypothetical protein
MGKMKELAIEQLALEIEAENVAREVPLLTLECEHMLSLLRECRDLLARIEGEEWSQYCYTGDESKPVSVSVQNMIDKIEKLEENIKQK